MQKLNAGLSVGEIDKIASDYQVSFTDEVYDLFTWKNGIQHDVASTDTQLLLFPNGIPFSLSEAADDFDLLSVTKHFFEPNYFPLFSGNNENILLIDLGQDSPTYKTISLYSPSLFGSSDPMTIYDSFLSMIETAIACYDQKAFWVDQDSLQVNQDVYYSIAGNLNPNSQYWQYM
ncbi:MAG: hypothetical protein KF746_08320 [Chitinophagaceae bacterium]|nr:hypothetical protein [Chitinophagaceae bacterium]